MLLSLFSQECSSLDLNKCRSTRKNNFFRVGFNANRNPANGFLFIPQHHRGLLAEIGEVGFGGQQLFGGSFGFADEGPNVCYR